MTIDTAAIKARTDLMALVEQYTQLTGTKERAGACPRCGGTDRFHVTPAWWFCRRCHPKRGDAIDFVQWLEGVGFREAVARLDRGAIESVPLSGLPGTPWVPAPKGPPARPQPARRRQASCQAGRRWDAKYAQGVADEANRQLLDWDSGQPGRNYLLGRGLQPAAWLMFGLGYDEAVNVPGTQGREKAPAIVIPWRNHNRVFAIRYRFLEAHNRHKQTAMPGSRFAGKLYGGQAWLGYGAQAGETGTLRVLGPLGRPTTKARARF